jgi:hypothetical protein
MANMLVLLVKLLNLFLKSVSKHKDCPDGICEAPLSLAVSLESQLKSPNVSFGIFDLLSFLRCFPMDRVVAVGKRIVAVLKGCNSCPDGDCGFLDILGCLDLKEVVSICTEILAIIRDSQICKGDGGTEITLGQAVS